MHWRSSFESFTAGRLYRLTYRGGASVADRVHQTQQIARAGRQKILGFECADAAKGLSPESIHVADRTCWGYRGARTLNLRTFQFGWLVLTSACVRRQPPALALGSISG